MCFCSWKKMNWDKKRSERHKIREGETVWERERKAFLLLLQNRYLIHTTTAMTHILTDHKTINYNSFTNKYKCVQRLTHTTSLALRSLEEILSSATFSFRFWIVPLYSFFPVVTLTQAERKWRGDGENVSTEDTGCSFCPHKLSCEVRNMKTFMVYGLVHLHFLIWIIWII